MFRKAFQTASKNRTEFLFWVETSVESKRTDLRGLMSSHEVPR